MKSIAALLGAAVLAAPLTCASLAHATAAQFCDELGASWDGTTCATSVISDRQAQMDISLGLPVALMDNPAASAALRTYHRTLMNAWRKTATTMIRDSTASTDYQLYPGPGSVQSLIIHEMFQPAGVQANNAYRSFIFDMATGRRLQLTDIFKPGVDPLRVIPPAARTVLPAALDAAAPPHQPGSYPFTVDQWEPRPQDGGYSGNYRAFGLTSDSLVLYLPDAPMAHEDVVPQNRFVWSMDGGAVIIHVPLSALAGSLRPEYRGT